MTPRYGGSTKEDRMYAPKFTLTSAIAKALMEIEACRQAIVRLPLTAPMLESLRKTARLLSTHFSTQIEGNRLSPSQVEDVLQGGGGFPGRERDEAEVRNYYLALEYATAQGRKKDRLTEQVVRTIHGLVLHGRPKPTKYRDGQNVIRDGRSGGLVYLPPEAKDVPRLVKELLAWLADAMRRDELPIPIIAAIAHYQFATIHPYYDGNGRTARLLTTLLLHRGSYGLHGIYSLEEYYAKHLAGYYDALAIGGSHNYYMGRAKAEITPFLDYFCRGMADSFARVRAQAEAAQRRGETNQAAALRELTAQQRKALSLFAKTMSIAARDAASFFGISARAASALCLKWVEQGFLVVADPSKKARRYRLAPNHEHLVTG
jgi:Fic family protein